MGHSHFAPAFQFALVSDTELNIVQLETGDCTAIRCSFHIEYSPIPMRRNNLIVSCDGSEQKKVAHELQGCLKMMDSQIPQCNLRPQTTSYF